MIQIDGSYGEGGGQILRTALALSSLLQKPVEINNIRPKRSKPGLRPQHLAAVRSLFLITEAQLLGDQLDSTYLQFVPTTLDGGEYIFDIAEEIKSAGSITLLFQAIFLPLAFASISTNVTLRGGTHVAWSPPFHYLKEIFLPTLYLMGYRGSLELCRWGWYPRGLGEALLQVEPISKLDPISSLERGQLRGIRGVSASSNLPEHVAQRQSQQVKKRLKGLRVPIEIDIMHPDSMDQGSFVFLALELEKGRAGFSALGERGKRAEKVADEAVDQLLYYLDTEAAIEEHLADQLILPMALAQGTSHFFTCRISQHLLTSIWVVKHFLPVEFKVEGDEGDPGKVHCYPRA
jgi:RNA 3'-terminal phosphate cyclase (ATP)